ncbi:MAG: glyoxalase/bleomycin resistance/dioxygenase family protein [Dehalococcoidia bacterium]|jgi:predicted enzyme related to lactoylglutathione lyase|nr:glyoxalase/bleomycin resistance/dioxygenase family protein [Dehalococcoidia bacterium]
MAVKRLRQAYVVAEDIDAVAAFYADGLGLELQFRDGDRWVQYGAGDVSFGVASVEESGGAAIGSAVPVFEVDDIAAQIATATAAGATLVSSRDMDGHGQMATLTEPSGALIALMQRAG